LEIVKVLLAQERIEVNKGNKGDASPFYISCQEGHKEVVSLLLADPRIDPNKAKNDGATPFFMTCQNGHKEVVSLLLADPRIDPNKPRSDQSTPLWYASQNGHLVIVQHLLATGREIDTRRRSTFNNRTAAEQGRAMGARTKDPTTLTKITKEEKPMAPSVPTSLMNTSGSQNTSVFFIDPAASQACENTSLDTSFPWWFFTPTPSPSSTRELPTPTARDSLGSCPGFHLICRWYCATGSLAHPRT